MKKLIITLSTEYLKIRKSKVIWITMLVFIFIPSMMSLLFHIAKNPELAAKLGLIGTKANMFGNGDWQAYIDLLIQLIAMLGTIGFGFITSWIFGREYVERTISDILALPVSRTYIVIAKIIIVIAISILLSIVLITFGFIMGNIVNISGWSKDIALQSIGKYLLTALLSITLCTPVAFLACYGRGYLLPIGFIILTLIMAQIAGVIGLGPYFPWAIPGLYSLPEASEGMELIQASYIILISTSLIGLFCNLAWWHYADQK